MCYIVTSESNQNLTVTRQYIVDEYKIGAGNLPF